MSNKHEIASGQVVLVKDHPIPGMETQCMVLYKINEFAIEVIPYDGSRLIGSIGGGIPARDILHVFSRLTDEEYIRLIVAAGVGKEETARKIYKRPAISYVITS